MKPPRTLPEGVTRPGWKPSLVRMSDPMPCPEFECGAPLLQNVESFTLVCTNGHRHRKEDLWNKGLWQAHLERKGRP